MTEEDYRWAEHASHHNQDREDNRERRQEHQRQHRDEAEARGIAEKRMNERLQGMNEFRDQLKDQASAFLPRNEYYTNHKALESKLETTVQGMESSLEAAIDRVLTVTQTNAKDIADIRSERKGMVSTVRFLVGAIGVVLTVLTIVVILTSR
jgi:hypothetical protein